MAASWPTSIATDSTLYIAVNELQNNLSGAINSAVTTVGLNSTTSFPTVGLVLIDNEIIKYTGVSGNSLTGCTRGFDGTTAAAHSSAAVVSFAFCAAHHNNLKDEIIAVETSLNLTASKALSTDTNGRVAVATTTLAELNFVAGVTSAIQTQLNAKVSAANPTLTGTVTIPNGVNATDAAAFGQLFAGFQAPVQATTATGSSTTSSTFQNTALAASIAPGTNTRRVKITVTCTGAVDTNGNNAYFTIKRGSTNIGGTNGFVALTTTAGGVTIAPVSITYIDSPATTSSTTYTVAIASSNNSGTVEFMAAGSQKAVIILEEIV